jgi:hypothetical protein
MCRTRPRGLVASSCQEMRGSPVHICPVVWSSRPPLRQAPRRCSRAPRVAPRPVLTKHDDVEVLVLLCKHLRHIYKGV